MIAIKNFTYENIKGIVFLDAVRRPYMCRKWENEIWLFYWHIDHWVSLRPVKENDRIPNNLSTNEQNLYHKKHLEWVKIHDISH